MAPRHAVSIATVLMMAIFFSFSATAYEVYRWVDEDGVPHFSQWKPEHSAGVTTLRITATNPPEYDPSEDPYSIHKQAQRTNTVWRNMEQRRAARNARQLEAAERAARTVLRPVEPVQYYAAPVFFRPIHHSKFFRHRQHHIKKVQHHQLFEERSFDPGSETVLKSRSRYHQGPWKMYRSKPRISFIRSKPGIESWYRFRAAGFLLWIGIRRPS